MSQRQRSEYEAGWSENRPPGYRSINEEFFGRPARGRVEPEEGTEEEPEEEVDGE